MLHTREHYRTTQIPVVFDRSADAPRFRQFLHECFLNDPDQVQKVTVVLEAIGYTLLSSTKYEKFFMIIGNGANGKSVLLDVILNLIGLKNVSAVSPSQFDNKFQRAHLAGKLANIVTEIAQGAEIADAQLKSIVSGELTTAEHKMKSPFDFSPVATCWFGTNHLPHTRDFSDALFRRAFIIPFNQKFEGANCDVHLKNKLLRELPGILNLALAAIAEVFQRGEFTTFQEMQEIKNDWKTEADQVAQFVEDCCTIDFQCGSTPSQVIFARYKSWAEEVGIRRTLNRNNFTKRLRRFGVIPGKSGSIRVLKNITLR